MLRGNLLLVLPSESFQREAASKDSRSEDNVAIHRRDLLLVVVIDAVGATFIKGELEVLDDIVDLIKGMPYLVISITRW